MDAEAAAILIIPVGAGETAIVRRLGDGAGPGGAVIDLIVELAVGAVFTEEHRAVIGF